MDQCEPGDEAGANFAAGGTGLVCRLIPVIRAIAKDCEIGEQTLSMIEGGGCVPAARAQIAGTAILEGHRGRSSRCEELGLASHPRRWVTEHQFPRLADWVTG